MVHQTTFVNYVTGERLDNMVKTTECTPEVQAGRLRKANGFLGAADIIEPYTSENVNLADAYVTLCVHAGIAASDVICCATQHRHSIDSDHKSAVAYLAEVDRPNSVHLDTLVSVKTQSGYTHIHATPELCEDVKTAATALVAAARLV